MKLWWEDAAISLTTPYPTYQYMHRYCGGSLDGVMQKGVFAMGKDRGVFTLFDDVVIFSSRKVDR